MTFSYQLGDADSPAGLGALVQAAEGDHQSHVQQAYIHHAGAQYVLVAGGHWGAAGAVAGSSCTGLDGSALLEDDAARRMRKRLGFSDST